MTIQNNPESRFLEVGGLNLHHLDWGNPSAAPLVCVHGFRGNAHSFDGFARRFRDRFHVISFDVRGRGDSAWSPQGAYTIEAYVGDLETELAALGLRHFTLVGTSMGGRIAMTYAGRHPDSLDRLVINDIGPDREAGSDRITREAATVPESFASLEEAIAYRARMSAAVARLTEAAQREAALTHVRQAPDGRWLWKNDPEFLRQRAAGGAASSPELWAVLARLPCPTLLVWAMESDVLSEGQAKKVVATLPKGELVSVPGVGHAPTLNEPAAVDALERFLAQPVLTSAKT